MTAHQEEKPSVLELFAGVGGFRLGLEAAGWRTIWSNQWEPSTKIQHASSCYVANFGPDGHSNEDIAAAIDSDITGQLPIPNADMIVGGFPCQDYSVAKSLRASTGLEGKKGVLWWEIRRLVELKRPKLVFLENVDRLLKSPSPQRGRDFAVMLRTLGDLGYFVEWKVVNSAEFGFNQRRIRVFIVAIRHDFLGDKEADLQVLLRKGVLNTVFRASHSEGFDIFKLDSNPERISKDFNLGGKKSPFQNSGAYFEGSVVTGKACSNLESSPTGRLGNVVAPDSSVPEEYWIEPGRLKDWEFLKGAKSLSRVSSSGHEYSYSEGKMAFPDSLDKPSRTILTGEGGSSPSRFKHIISTDQGYRRLMPIELERLNGFPDDWTKRDAEGRVIPDARRAFFMGNALVVGLIEMVGAELKSRYFTN